MKVIKLLYLLIFSSFSVVLYSQTTAKDTVRSDFAEYTRLVKEGHLIEASNFLSSLLNSNKQLTDVRRLAINNNLGILHKKLGQYDIALKYYDAAELIYLNNSFTDYSSLAGIYGNKANIYSMKGDLNKALEYTEKAIRFIQGGKSTDLVKQQSIHLLYLNAGIVYYQMNNFSMALSSFKQSLYLKDKYKQPGKDNAYLNLAKTYAKMGNNIMADKYFSQSIKQSEAENGNFSGNLVNIYLEYGNYLMSVNKYAKGLTIFQTALKINLKISGEKNIVTSNCYQFLGDYYRNIKDYHKTLFYYQKTLVSGSKDFSDTLIRANPSIIDISLNLWQLRVLTRKAEVLAIIADGEKEKNIKISYFSASLATINVAIEMTNTIRVDYQDEETRMLFSGRQKNVFVAAIETALKLYGLTGESSYLSLAYQTTQQYKANELKYEIARNKLFSNNEIPDSLRNKEKELKKDIAAYSALINSELALSKPDTAKLAFWKDKQFDLKRALEKKVEEIERNYPLFIDKIKGGNIISLETIRNNLKSEENLIEYVISERDENGSRKLFCFVITPTGLYCHNELIDSTLSSDFSSLKAQLSHQVSEGRGIDNYNQLNRRLFNSYKVLIQPLEKYFTGKQLIIIPDEEISYLPFDAFLTSWKIRSKINYAELNYLINEYSLSYSYSTNTLWNKQLRAEFFPKVIGFAPDYSTTAAVDGREYASLKSSSKEVESILNNFDGVGFKAGRATIANFRSNLNSGSILHLAMHSELDTSQSGTSSLVFTPDTKNQGTYRLYNYEIGQMSINSPMVVLSACNTGSGKLYSGEGLMSLARNFVLAGVPSVVETLWPVEDVSSARIMGDFYKYLSEGKPKGTALRMAKLDYISNTSPSFVNPKFWAAYTLIGDVSAIKKIWWEEPWIIIPLMIAASIAALILLVYLLKVFGKFQQRFS
jgi:CHAT domain-containing protein